MLFRGNAEGTIRKRLLQQGFIKGVIGLPANLFYGTGIPACIVILDKENAVARTGVFMIDASKGFMKDGNKNRLRSQDLHKIVDTFNKQTEIPRYSRMVPLSEIVDGNNDFNLNIPRYIDSSEPEDLQDLNAHLHGGIPNADLDTLSRYWDAFPQLRRQLFKPNRPGYSDLTIEVACVQKTILDSPEFRKFAEEARGLTADWFTAHRDALAALDKNIKPAQLIGAISDDLLARFKPVPLLDEYDVYEQLMIYWHETVHDDVFLIMNDGWLDAAKPRKTIEDKDRKFNEDPDLAIGTGKTAQKFKMDLVPPDLVVARYFVGDQSALDMLEARLEKSTTQLDEHAEEHGGDEGLLSEATNDKGRYTQQALTATIREAKASRDTETLAVAEQALRLMRVEAAAKKAAKNARSVLDANVLQKYAMLSTSDVQSIVLDSKWDANIASGVHSVVQGLTSALVKRVEQLGQRYGETLKYVEARAASLGDSVDRVVNRIERIAPTTTVRLRDVGATYGGLTGKTKADFGKGDAKFVTFVEVINNVRLSGRSLEAVVVSKGERQHRVMKNDVLFNGSSETPEEVALSAVVTFDPSHDTYLNSFCFGFRLKRSDVVDPTYLAYFFRTRQGRALVSSLAQGATRYNIAKTKLLEVDVPVPPLARQRDVVSSVVEAEDLVSALVRLTEKQRWIAEGLSQTAFAGAGSDDE